MCLSCEDIVRQNCTMVRRCRLFGDFFASCIFSEPRAARFRPASQIRTKTTSCVEVWQTSNLRPLRLGEEKKKERRKNDRMKIYTVCPATINKCRSRSHLMHVLIPRGSAGSGHPQKFDCLCLLWLGPPRKFSRCGCNLYAPFSEHI